MRLSRNKSENLKSQGYSNGSDVRMGCTFVYTNKTTQEWYCTDPQDSKRLNKRLVRKPFPLPKISTVLQELESISYATALDLYMGYYTIRLDNDASRICTINFPWGKYSYKRLPMGIAGSPFISQVEMSELMRNLEFVRTYLDDLLIITKLNLSDILDK